MFRTKILIPRAFPAINELDFENRF